MIDPFPEDWELVSFFETEPVDEYTDIPIDFRKRTYTTAPKRGEWIECAIDRASEAVSIGWFREEGQVLRLELQWVSELVLRRDRSGEEMVLRFKDPNLEQLRLRLRPSLLVDWGIKMYPDS